MEKYTVVFYYQDEHDSEYKGIVVAYDMVSSQVLHFHFLDDLDLPGDNLMVHYDSGGVLESPWETRSEVEEELLNVSKRAGYSIKRSYNTDFLPGAERVANDFNILLGYVADELGIVQPLGWWDGGSA